MNGIPRLPLNYLVVKTPNLTAIPAMGPNYPSGDSIQITQGLHPTSALVRTLWRIKIPPGQFYPNHIGLEGYTRWVRSRAPSSELKYPSGDSIRITRGLGGYTHRVRSRAPSGESKYPLGDSIRITRGLGGYTHRVRLRAPSGESNHP